MILFDIDGVCVDFYGTAKKFGIELELNVFDKWKWGTDGYPTPEEFYAVAKRQKWLTELGCDFYHEDACFITNDFLDIKEEWFEKHNQRIISLFNYEAKDKSKICLNPIDLLVDDNPNECERWRIRGGIAYWFNLAEKDPYKKFLKWWKLGGTK